MFGLYSTSFAVPTPAYKAAAMAVAAVSDVVFGDEIFVFTKIDAAIKNYIFYFVFFFMLFIQNFESKISFPVLLLKSLVTLLFLATFH